MKWYNRLYLGSGLEGKKEKLIRKLECNAGVPGLCLLTLASNGKDLFDIFSADYLLQPVLHGHCPMIVALTKSHEEAVEIAIQITMEAYEKTGTFDVKSYLLSCVPESEDPVTEYPMDRLRPRRRSLFGKKQ